MEKTVRDGRSIIMRQDTRSAYSECICQNGNRHCRSDNDDRTPEPVALQPGETTPGRRAIAVAVVTGRMRKVSKHDREREEGHKRSDTTASLDDFELPRFKRVKWF